jgi:hypothetical protein
MGFDDFSQILFACLLTPLFHADINIRTLNDGEEKVPLFAEEEVKWPPNMTGN